MAGHQLHGMCCAERLIKIGTAPAMGISPNPARPLTQDSARYPHVCVVQRGRSDAGPAVLQLHDEYLLDIPKQPDNWSEGSFAQKMLHQCGPRGSATMPEIALVTLARQKYDATGSFGAAIPIAAVIEGTSPDEALADRYQQGRIPAHGPQLASA